MKITTKAYFITHIATILYGITGILGKLISLNSNSLVWIRLFFAVITLLLVFGLKKQKLTLNSRKDYIRMGIIGSVLALHWFTFFEAIKIANVTIALVSFSTFPLFTAIIEPFINKHGMRKQDILLSLLILFGTYICFPEFDLSNQTSLGFIYGLISAALIGFVFVLSKPLTERYNGETCAFYQLLAAFLFMTIFNIETFLTFAEISISDWIYLFVLGVLCTALTTVLSYQAMEVLRAYTISIIINLEPVYGILLSVLIFPESEVMTTHFYIGGGIILVASFMEPFLPQLKNFIKLKKSSFTI